jgi:hypothetical protein
MSIGTPFLRDARYLTVAIFFRGARYLTSRLVLTAAPSPLEPPA